MSEISFDPRAVTIDGKRTLVISGAIHYPRSTPSMWPALFRRSREAGLNTVETYAFWNLHERQRGLYDFAGRLDLVRFCQLAQQAGLNVILRIGPYICAETNYGGFPAWLRDVPGMQMRTWNEPFMQEMARWVRLLTDRLRPMLAPNGGPIVMAQIENEYSLVAKNNGQAGQQYLQWAIDLGRSLDLGIPWVMCAGGAEGAIETINGFYAHRQIDAHVAAHPEQPALWTENWPAWYDTFGYGHHVRTSEDLAYGVARFFAAGGTGVNYYMWHGGTNFGRESMYLQTTSYDFAAPLDEFGLETTKGNHIARLHRILTEYADVLLPCNPARAEPLGPKQAAFAYEHDGRRLEFLANDDAAPACVQFRGRDVELPAMAVLLLGNGQPLMNTAHIDTPAVVQRAMHPLPGALSGLECWPEPQPEAWPANLPSGVVANLPIEQLQITRDQTDYCWYSTVLRLPPELAGQGELTLEAAGDMVHVFVDGKLQASTPAPLVEDRGPIHGEGFRQRFSLTLGEGEHAMSLLCCAMGLIKGDWMIGHQNMAEERKGIWGEVRWNGHELPGPWTMRAGLVGEHERAFAEGTAPSRWQMGPATGQPHPLRWLRLRFDRPRGDAPLAIDLQGMDKGMAWLNGQCVGRYWLTPAVKPAPDWLKPVILDERMGEPTQRYYHLPAEWLEDSNTLVLLEELAGDPAGIQLCQWK